MSYVYFFFFSSRRRHTRYWRDWSSDVCSSDLTICFSFFSLFSTVPVDISCVVSTALFFPIYSSSIFMLLHRQSQNYNIRSEEHTSELQSRQYLVCRLLLEKKKKQYTYHMSELHSRL